MPLFKAGQSVRTNQEEVVLEVIKEYEVALIFHDGQCYV